MEKLFSNSNFTIGLFIAIAILALLFIIVLILAINDAKKRSKVEANELALDAATDQAEKDFNELKEEEITLKKEDTPEVTPIPVTIEEKNIAVETKPESPIVETSKAEAPIIETKTEPTSTYKPDYSFMDSLKEESTPKMTLTKEPESIKEPTSSTEAKEPSIDFDTLIASLNTSIEEDKPTEVISKEVPVEEPKIENNASELDFEQLKAQLNSISDAPAASSLDKINQPTTPAAFVINDESSKPVLEPLKESKLNLGDFDATTVIKTIKTPEQFSSVFVNKTMNPVSTPITDISEPDLPKLSDSVEPVKVLEQSPVIDSKEQRNFTNIETEEYTLK